MPSTPSPSLRPYLWEFDASRYPRAFLFGQVSEEKVQDLIRTSLPLLGVTPQWVDSGGAAMRGKAWSAVMRLLAGFGLRGPAAESKARAFLKEIGGVSAADVGRSDLSGVLAPAGRAWFLEVKQPAWLNPKTGGIVRSAGKPTPEQLAFLDARHREGAIVGVVWSLQDAIDVLGLKGARPKF